MATYDVDIFTNYDGESGIIQRLIEANGYGTTNANSNPSTSPIIDVNPGDAIRFRWIGSVSFPSGNGPSSVQAYSLDSGVFNTSDPDYDDEGGFGSATINTVGGSTTVSISNSPDFITDTVRIWVPGEAGWFYTYVRIRVLNPVDTLPDSFNFGSNITGAAPGQTYYALAVRVTGINTPVSVRRLSGTGGFAARVNDGSWVSLSTSTLTASNNDIVYLRCTTSTAFNNTRSITVGIGDRSDSWSVTTGNEDAQKFIPLGITTGNIELMDDIGDFFGQRAFNDARLTDYYRGGAYVPNITENNGVPTSGLIGVDDFYGSGTSFFFQTFPSGKSVNHNSLGGNTTLSLIWAAGVDWNMGYGDGMNDRAQFRYTMSFNKQEIIGSTSGPILLSQSGSPGTWGSNNRSVEVECFAPQNSEIFISGTVTVHARFGTLGSSEISREIPFAMTIYGP